MQEAITDLRRALERPLAPLPPETGVTLAEEVERLQSSIGAPVVVDWPPGVTVPLDLEPLTQSVLGEALRNISKHASPSCVEVRVARDADTFTLEVRNDGVRPGARGGGMGLRLAAFEALQQGGMVEFGPDDADGWRVRLVVPLEQGTRRERGGGSDAPAGGMGPTSGGCGSWWSMTTTSSTGGSGSCSESSRGSSGAWPPATGAEALELTRRVHARTSRWSTCSWPASPGPTCASRSVRPRPRPVCC